VAHERLPAWRPQEDDLFFFKKSNFLKSRSILQRLTDSERADGAAAHFGWECCLHCDLARIAFLYDEKGQVPIVLTVPGFANLP
jgi:hypothetical protein